VTALLLGYNDIPRARDFFVGALGFLEEWTATDDTGQLIRSHVRFRDTVLMLDKPGSHDVKHPGKVGGVTHVVVISVGDVDAHFERAVAAGANVHGPPTDRPWGREFELSDPEGYRFAFIP
jgi:uncharacterized glyoxalase superfamily protein PhnB